MGFQLALEPPANLGSIPCTENDSFARDNNIYQPLFSRAVCCGRV